MRVWLAVLALLPVLARGSVVAQTTPANAADELIKAHPDPNALGNAALKQCAKLPSLLACYLYLRDAHDRATPRQRVAIDQLLAPTASFLGRYADAAHYDPFDSPADSDVAEAPVPQYGFHAVDAADGVAALAHDRRIVMVNEYHMDASTRQLTLALLPRLYAMGFRYLAVEALWEDGARLAARGYAVEDSGYYTREPVFAQLLARAVQLGYTLVKYDVEGGGQRREDAQARTIQTAVFAHDPEARVLVHAGLSHIDEKTGNLGRGVKPMAMRLHALTGFDPLTVDQSRLREDAAHGGSPLYRELVHAYEPKRPTVLFDHDGKPWSDEPGIHDVTVLLPPLSRTPGRSSWLALDGMRRAVRIRTDDCRNRIPCTVAAWPAGRPDDAVPSDRYAFLQPDQSAFLYLAPGRYRVEATDAGSRPLSHRYLNVEAHSQ